MHFSLKVWDNVLFELGSGWIEQELSTLQSWLTPEGGVGRGEREGVRGRSEGGGIL